MRWPLAYKAQLGARYVYPIRYTILERIGCVFCVPDRVPSQYYPMTWPLAYKAWLGARYVYPIGYTTYVPDREQECLYPPSFEGSVEFCGWDTCRDNLKSYCTNSNSEIQNHPWFGVMLLLPFLLNYLASFITWLRLDNKKFTFISTLLNLYAP